MRKQKKKSEQKGARKLLSTKAGTAKKSPPKLGGASAIKHLSAVR
jgi:hypothetical protein